MSFKTFVNFSIFQTFTNLPNIAYCNIIDPESKTQLTLPLFVCVCWLRTSPTDPAVPIQTSEVPDTAACRRHGLPHLLSFNRVTLCHGESRYRPSRFRLWDLVELIAPSLLVELSSRADLIGIPVSNRKEEASGDWTTLSVLALYTNSAFSRENVQGEGEPGTGNKFTIIQLIKNKFYHSSCNGKRRANQHCPRRRGASWGWSKIPSFTDSITQFLIVKNSSMSIGS